MRDGFAYMKVFVPLDDFGVQKRASNLLKQIEVQTFVNFHIAH